jgi:NitT/TauT family transport system substrate-binding protein
MSEQQGTGLTVLGRLISILMVLALLGGGFYLLRMRFSTPQAAPQAGPAPQQATPQPSAVAPAELKAEVPTLSPPAPYQPKDNIIDVELSEYAGYAGLIVANGGLEPTENSLFFRNHGFKVHLTLSEEESWSKLNSGGMAASATTADVLAVYGRQFNVIVPALIGFSRGADGVVVRSDVKRINQLKGQTLATSQFTEAEFFIRYLAQEAGLGVNMLPDIDAQPHPEKVNLVFAEDAFEAGDLFLQDLTSGTNKLAGTVTWAPKTTEVANGSGGKAHVLVTNTNLLIVADILIVNKGFAQQNPKVVAGLVDGLLEGNRLVRENPDAQSDVLARALKWDRANVKAELAKVHLANLPENQAFFSGAIDAAGSFGGIYQSAVYAYGPALIPDPPPAERFVDLSHLKALEQSGKYAGQKIEIAPISSSAAPAIEENPLLSKDIRFLFVPNSHELDMASQFNLQNLDSIKQLLQVSPGSVIVLEGHVDDARKQEFEQLGASMLRTMSLKAVDLSKKRADEVEKRLVERLSVDEKRVETVGRGWDEPAGNDPDPEKRMEQNRRVEVQWFTVE